MSSDTHTGPDWSGEVDEPEAPQATPQDPDPDSSETDWEPEGDLVELDPPRMNTGGLRQLYRARKHLRKQEKLASKGYVRWHRIGDSFARPEYVKPDRKGGGIPEKEVDGETYLFPKSAMVPADNGMWTIIHREGEADPINLRDPVQTAIDADRLKEYLDLRVSSSSPSWLDSIGSYDIIKVVIAGVIAFAVIQNFM